LVTKKSILYCLILLILAGIGSRIYIVEKQEKELEQSLEEIRSNLSAGTNIDKVRSFLKDRTIQYAEEKKEGGDWGSVDDIYSDFFVQIVFVLQGPDYKLGLVSQSVIVKVRFNENLKVMEVAFIYGYSSF
tara:strand:+ start:106022 stop:106414 length:393 start_codon:yes stop_codon:yes gene_type:complete